MKLETQGMRELSGEDSILPLTEDFGLQTASNSALAFQREKPHIIPHTDRMATTLSSFLKMAGAIHLSHRPASMGTSGSTWFAVKIFLFFNKKSDLFKL